MNLKPVSRTFRSLGRAAKRNAPVISLVIAGVSFVGATISAIKATSVSVRQIDKATEEKGEKLSAKEIIKACGKNYIPTALATATGVTALVIGGRGYHTRYKSVAALLAATETSKKQLEEVVLEKFGEKKFEEVQNEVAKKQLETDPVSKSSVYSTGKGTTLCKDSLSGRYFRCDIEQIKRGLNAFNERLLKCECLDYNELFYCIDPRMEEISFGGDVGWNIRDGLLTLHYTTQLADTGEPCLVISYPVPPSIHFDRY